MDKPMFENVTVGDRVWSMQGEWGIVDKIEEGSLLPLIVRFDNGEIHLYDLSGKFFNRDKNPTLFWSEVKFEIPPTPSPP
jgi:hypothetical protein